MRRRCSRVDLTVELWVNMLVDGDGLPIGSPNWQAAIAAAAFPYWCVNCDRRFESWDTAKGHLQSSHLQVVSDP